MSEASPVTTRISATQSARTGALRENDASLLGYHRLSSLDPAGSPTRLRASSSRSIPHHAIALKARHSKLTQTKRSNRPGSVLSQLAMLTSSSTHPCQTIVPMRQINKPDAYTSNPLRDQAARSPRSTLAASVAPADQ